MHNYISKFIILAVAGSLLSYCTPTKKELPELGGWQKVYVHDKEGKGVFGEKQKLIDAVRQGYSVRVGWGWQRELGDSTLRLEHMAAPIFLSIIQEETVSAIIDGHPFLESYVHVDKQEFRDPHQLWQCVLTTKGTFNAKVFDLSSSSTLRDLPQQHRISWFVEYPSGKQIEPIKLFE